MSTLAPMRDRVLAGLLAGTSPAGPAARLSIAIFHRVLPQPDPLFPGEVWRERFDELCRWYAAWFHVLPLDEAAERLQAGTLPSRALCITFDDGYADNHDLAMPILQAHGLCATFFIATGFLDGGRMWNDTVIEVVRRCQGSALELGDIGVDGLGRIELETLDARRQSIDRILGAIKYLDPVLRQSLVDRIAERAGVTLPDNLMMRSEQVRALRRGGMQVGAHTVNHPILARQDEAAARGEMARSKATLEDLLGEPVPLFAYPNGKPGRDYGARDVALAQRAGFRAAVSTGHGAARRGTDLLFQLPRFTPWDRSAWRFGLRMWRNLHVAPTQA